MFLIKHPNHNHSVTWRTLVSCTWEPTGKINDSQRTTDVYERLQVKIAFVGIPTSLFIYFVCYFYVFPKAERYSVSELKLYQSLMFAPVFEQMNEKNEWKVNHIYCAKRLHAVQLHKHTQNTMTVYTTHAHANALWLYNVQEKFWRIFRTADFCCLTISPNFRLTDDDKLRQNWHFSKMTNVTWTLMRHEFNIM